MARDAGDRLDPADILYAYELGYFPMARSRAAASVVWVLPGMRGLLDLDAARLPRRLARTVRASTLEIRVDTAFRAVMEGCAAATPGRPDTWINPAIEEAYAELHGMGRAHSVECWRDGALVGGLDGVTLGAVFCGESMFSRERDASKIAMAHLIARLKATGFRLLDTQFHTEHLAQFGVAAVPNADYQAALQRLKTVRADFTAPDAQSAARTVLQSMTQTS